MSRQVFIFLSFVILFIFFYNPVYGARSLTILSNKISLFGYEEITITSSASGFTNGETIYIKGAFYQDGATNYFGYTQKEDSWIKNIDSAVNQKLIKIGEWDGTLVVKSDFLDSGYKGEGDYKFKVGFYYTTSGGNLSSVNWSSNILDIGINDPDPTPTLTLLPSFTPTPTLVSAPTSTSIPTKTPTPSSTKPPSLTQKPTPVSSGLTSIEPTIESIPTSVLGESTESESKEDDKPSKITPATEAKVLGTQTNNLSKILIGIGLIFIIACGALVFRTYIINKKDSGEV